MLARDTKGSQAGDAAAAYTAEAVRARLKTILVGRRVKFYEQVDSTNDLVAEAARKGGPEGLVIVAEEQLKGRGRLGRAWVAPPGCCVLCSVLLRPRFSPEHAFYLTVVASLAIYRACNEILKESKGEKAPSVTIKWPNDVRIKGRKVSGVLCESEFSGGGWSHAALGFGINANLSTEQLGGLAPRATSLANEAGHLIDRASLLVRTLEELEAMYLSLLGGQFSNVHAEWAAALDTVGKRVTVRSGKEPIEGQAVRVDPDGALVLRLDGGTEQRVLAGDVVTSRRKR